MWAFSCPEPPRLGLNPLFIMHITHSTTAPAEQACDALFSAADWQSLPRLAVRVQLHDGSVFLVAAQSLAGYAACRITVPGVAPAEHLRRQVLPAVLDAPELLLEFARQIPWADLKQAAYTALWRTPAIFVTEAYRSRAVMTLQPLGPD